MKLEQLRRFAITRSLFEPTTLERAIRRLGFVQADPIRAPARAQDLILRLRVKGYRAGDLERRYAKLGLDPPPGRGCRSRFEIVEAIDEVAAAGSRIEADFVALGRRLPGHEGRHLDVD